MWAALFRGLGSQTKWKENVSWAPAFRAICFLTMDTMWLAALFYWQHPFPATTDCIPFNCKPKYPPPFKSSCRHTNRSSNKHKSYENLDSGFFFWHFIFCFMSSKFLLPFLTFPPLMVLIFLYCCFFPRTWALCDSSHRTADNLRMPIASFDLFFFFCLFPFKPWY